MFLGAGHNLNRIVGSRIFDLVDFCSQREICVSLAFSYCLIRRLAPLTLEIPLGLDPFRVDQVAQIRLEPQIICAYISAAVIEITFGLERHELIMEPSLGTKTAVDLNLETLKFFAELHRCFCDVLTHIYLLKHTLYGLSYIDNFFFEPLNILIQPHH